VVNELRGAISAAQPGATIDFGGNIRIGATITLNLGQITINKNLTIDGGILGLTIDGGGRTNLFSVTNNAIVTIKNLTFNNGAVPAANGGDDGGAVFVTAGANVTIVGDNFTNNKAVGAPGGTIGAGGAIENFGTLTVTICTFTNNSANFGGGAIDSNSSNSP
jgi:predicted outer membrane repeat protein